jgi:hypothetical protein
MPDHDVRGPVTMTHMGELAERMTGVAARAVGNTMSPAVVAIMTAAAIAQHKPELATVWAVPVSALAGSLTEEGVQLVRQVWEDKARRVGHFADVAAEESGSSWDDLLSHAAHDEKVRELLARTVDGVASTIDSWKIEALAKVFANGASDGARIDDMLLLTGLVRELEGPHARLLAAFYRQHHPDAWTEDVVVSDVEALRADPALDTSLAVVATKLEQLGLVTALTPREVREIPTVPVADVRRVWRWTALGRLVADRLSELGAAPQPTVVP